MVSGGTGFIGANLVRRLLHDGNEVHVLTRPDCHVWRIQDILDDLHIHWVDLEDRDRVAGVVDEVEAEWHFNLAVYGAYPFQTDVRRMFSTNVLGTVNLVQAALQTGFEAFVHTGSSSEYGQKAYPVGESEWLEPNSNYAVTKASSTLFCRYAGKHEGAAIRTLRLYSAFGPWEEPSRLMPTLVLAGLLGRLPPLANPRTARDYVYIDDVIDAYLLAASVPDQEPGAVYNVGTGRQATLQEVVDVARQELSIAADPGWGSMPDRSWDTNVWVADSRTIRSALGWHPAHNLVAGFRSLANWVRDDPAVRQLYEHPVPATT